VATHDYVIANGTGAAVRSDLNDALAAIVSQNSSASAPATMYAYMLWADTTAGIMKMRNGANSAWISLWELDGTFIATDVSLSAGTAGAPSLYFTGDTNTGIYSPGADQVAISTGGTARLTTTTTGITSALAVDVPLGAVGTPSITFTGDTNTGIYSPGADQVALTTGGTQRLAADTAAVTSTLPVVHPLGAVGTPSITFTGDLNTGIYSPAADTLAFVEGGVEAMRIDSSGRLGIGTSPSELLHVSGGLVRLEDGASGSVIRFYKSSAQTAFISNRSFGFHDGNGLALQTSTADPIRFAINDSEAVRIDSSKRLLVGTSSARDRLFNSSGTESALIEVEGTSQNLVFSGVRNSADVGQPYIVLGKSRGTTVNSYTVVSSGDGLGSISFQGADGSELVNSAQISAEVDGTPGANDMPGRLVFSTTADGASSPTERMRIKSDGQLNTLSSVGGFYSTVTAAAGTTIPTFAGRRSGTTLDNGTDTCYIWSNGNIQNVNGSYTAISDQKLKENIADANSQWNDLKAIQIRNWNFKEETGHETHRQIGPIAQELEQVCPGLVFETPDRDADGNETGEVTKGVNQSVLYMKAVKALQEAMERIEALEADVAQLKSA
jgi:hypothetical protein